MDLRPVIVVVKTLEDGPLATVERSKDEVPERHIDVHRSVRRTDEFQEGGVCLASCRARGIHGLEARDGYAVLRGFPFESVDSDPSRAPRGANPSNAVAMSVAAFCVLRRRSE